jgi:hypothetical protein
MRFASTLFAAVALTAVSTVLVPRMRLSATGPHTVLLVPAEADFTRRLQAKTAVARQLKDGELTVPQAAACFRRLDTEFPSRTVVAPGEESLSEAERYCRTVIRCAVEVARQDSADRAKEASRRLNAELDAGRAAGQLRDWPDVP